MIQAILVIEDFLLLVFWKGWRRKRGGGWEERKKESKEGEGGVEEGSDSIFFLFHWNIREGGYSPILFCMQSAWLVLYPQSMLFRG